MSASALLSKLDRLSRTGADRWTARCPAHDDRGPSLAIRELSDGRMGEPSEEIRGRVARARERQAARLAGRPGVHANAHMRPRELREFCRVGEGSDALLRTAITRLGLSARAYHRVLKIARTLADLAGAGEIATEHVAEAIQYRSLDRLLRS